MSARKVGVHDLDDREEQNIGRINNELRPSREPEILATGQEIGRINNEQEPRLQREFLPEERVIGVINNEKRD
jgi:hypothetical protein